MKEHEYLLIKLGEEASEVIQNASKALVFGLGEVYHTQELTNAERLQNEFNDLMAVYDMLVNRGYLENTYTVDVYRAKKEKVERYMQYSRDIGILE